MLKIKKKKKLAIKRIIFALILFLFIFYPLTTSADSIADKQRELDALKKQMGEQKALIAQKQKEAQSLANEIALMDGQIKETELAIQATTIDIDKTAEEIGVKEQELKEQQKILNESLRLMYEEKQTSLLETLLSSRSFSSVLDRIEYLQVVKSKIDSTITSIKKIKSDLESKKTNLEQLQAEQVAQKTDLDSKRNERNLLLEQTKGEEALYQQKLATDKAKAAEVKSEMDRMEAASGGGGNHVGPPSTFGFQWPTISHWISCYYGWEGCSIYRGRYHTGIDLPGSTGTTIYAAAGGTVERVATDGYNGGYGNYILISHDGGFRTRYAHLSAVLVSAGQPVSRGDNIARMGSTGNSTGPHLHFEVLANNCVYGCDVNPLQYLP
jgi:murein DD-endopeptidase MepM/ murein hydrolase activator NlpD